MSPFHSDGKNSCITDDALFDGNSILQVGFVAGEDDKRRTTNSILHSRRPFVEMTQKKHSMTVCSPTNLGGAHERLIRSSLPPLPSPHANPRSSTPPAHHHPPPRRLMRAWLFLSVPSLPPNPRNHNLVEKPMIFHIN